MFHWSLCFCRITLAGRLQPFSVIWSQVFRCLQPFFLNLSFCFVCFLKIVLTHPDLLLFYMNFRVFFSVKKITYYWVTTVSTIQWSLSCLCGTWCPLICIFPFPILTSGYHHLVFASMNVTCFRLQISDILRSLSLLTCFISLKCNVLTGSPMLL